MKIFFIIFSCLFLHGPENVKQDYKSCPDYEEQENIQEPDLLNFNNQFIIPNNLLLVN